MNSSLLYPNSFRIFVTICAKEMAVGRIANDALIEILKIKY